MKIEMNLSEIKSREFISLLSEILYTNEHMFVLGEDTNIYAGRDCGNYIYTIVPMRAIKIIITNKHEQCDNDYPYAVLFYVDEDNYGVCPVQSNFVDVITKEFFEKIFKEEE